MYDAQFYTEQSPGSRRSASATVPLIMRLLNPRSVVDVGCGIGTWLAEFAAAGISDFAGLDGDYVSRSQLQIPAEKFVPSDLSQPLTFGRRYDLAISLEVAEHLPADSAATFIASLAAAAPVVLFAAAIPGQGGTGHVNEQWPDYWRALFRGHGYIAVDAVRPLVWGSKDVVWWYQQNMILYCDEQTLTSRPHLTPVPDERSLSVVHPSLFRREPGLRDALVTTGKLPFILANTVRAKLGRRLGLSRTVPQ